MLDTDEQAILFLCCGTHVVLCKVCGRDREIRTLRRRSSDPERWLCPKCRRDVSESVVGRTRECVYFTGRKSLSRISRSEEPPAAASA